MTRLVMLTLMLACTPVAYGQAPPAPLTKPPAEAKPTDPKPGDAKPGEPKPAELVLEDQFGRKQDLASLRGDVVVLIYGDRRATDACKELGEKLHVLFHPTAAGQPAGKARTAPVVALPGVAPGARSPDVFIVPVAATGTVPTLIRDLIRTQIKKAAPDTPVWLDFDGKMEKAYGLRAGQPNVVVFDGHALLRLKVAGAPDKAALEKLLQTVQNLRAEAAGIAVK